MMSKRRVHSDYQVNKITGLLKHVSSAPLSILSAHCISRSMVQSVNRVFCAWPLCLCAREPCGEARGSLTICRCHWGWHYLVHSAMPAQ